MALPTADGGFTRRDLLDQIADKWTALILRALCKGPLRFNALRRSLDGITQTALTNALRRMERNGILARRVISTKPIAVEYEITPLGRSLEPLFMALDDWTETYFEAVALARSDFEQEAI
ncbi:MAG: winged helix-turn-helix transcriptional regulator [Brevundimonas sp.]